MLFKRSRERGYLVAHTDPLFVAGRLGLGARQIWLKIKLISRLGAGPSPVSLCLRSTASLRPACSLSSSLVPRRHEQIEGTGLEGGEGGGAEVLHATDTDLEARREGGAATKSFRLLAATRRPGPYLSRSSFPLVSRFHHRSARSPNYFLDLHL